MNGDISKYKDIINLNHPTSKKHPRLSVEQRAAQFAPFAALTGFGKIINETAEKNEKNMNKKNTL